MNAYHEPSPYSLHKALTRAIDQVTREMKEIDGPDLAQCFSLYEQLFYVREELWARRASLTSLL